MMVLQQESSFALHWDMLCGLVMIPLSLLRLWSGWLFGALLAVMVLIPAVYSYALHRKGI